ncbi:MAG TPA: hypothetical protein VKZ46_02430, partial [Pedomonas sp.]|nr:hypothetical protein [Pedomonas sp.]
MTGAARLLKPNKRRRLLKGAARKTDGRCRRVETLLRKSSLQTEGFLKPFVGRTFLIAGRTALLES